MVDLIGSSAVFILFLAGFGLLVIISQLRKGKKR